MQREVPTWLAVVIILVVLIVVVGAYVYFTRPKRPTEVGMPPHAPSGHHPLPIQKGPAPQAQPQTQPQAQPQAQPQGQPQTQPQTQPQAQPQGQ